MPRKDATLEAAAHAREAGRAARDARGRRATSDRSTTEPLARAAEIRREARGDPSVAATS